MTRAKLKEWLVDQITWNPWVHYPLAYALAFLWLAFWFGLFVGFFVLLDYLFPCTDGCV